MTDAPCKGCTDRTAGCQIANSYAISTIRKIKKEQRRRRR